MAKNDLNVVILRGNLTFDPELRHTPAGTAVTTVRVANNRSYGENDWVNYVDVELWGKKAELVAEYFSKGSPIEITGELKTDTWDDKSTGEKRSKIVVKATDFYFVGGGSGQKNDEPEEKPVKSETKPKRGRRPKNEADDDDCPI
jgi:single-strand DNA-binding protein